MAGGRRSHGQGTFWGDLIGPNPTDRGKAGTKRSLLVDGEGGPLSIVVAGANVHDAKLLEATLDAIVVERPQPTEEEPQHLCLDKGYDNVPCGPGPVRQEGSELPRCVTARMCAPVVPATVASGHFEIVTKWVDGAMSRTRHRRVILDMDSSESPVHGEQEGASYNGHFGSTCYHPLFVFNQFGDCEGAMLRAGNVHSAHRWRDVLDPILSRYGATGVRRYFRADAAFAKPDIYEYMEERRVFYAIRLPSNKVLQYEIAPLLIRPVGSPPKRPVIRYDDFWYRAESFDRDRRVVAKVEWHRGELFPRVGFIVTNMTAGPEGVVRFYNV